MSDEIPSAIRAPDFVPHELPMQQISSTHFVRQTEGG